MDDGIETYNELLLSLPERSRNNSSINKSNSNSYHCLGTKCMSDILLSAYLLRLF